MSVILIVRHARLERQALDGAGWPGVLSWPVANHVGESPVWDQEAGALLWIDVRAPALLRLDLASDTVSRWDLPEVVGALALAGAGQVVVALRRNLAVLDMAAARLKAWTTVDCEPAGNRLNDGKVSPTGRWWLFGSMDDGPAPKQPTGALYRIGLDGNIRRLRAGLYVANGIAFTPCGTGLWFSDSHAGQVYCAPWDEATGTMGTPALWCTSLEAAGRPDGAAVDRAGTYWSAGVSAGCLNGYGVAGRLTNKVMLPCRAPTMPCFGGTGLRTVFVTSLVRPHWPAAAGSLDGALLAIPAHVPGLGVPAFGIERF